MAETIGARFEINAKDAEATIQRFEQLMGVMKKTVGDVKKELSGLYVDETGAVQKRTQAVEQGTEALKDFRGEQRQQDFVMREARQSITAVAFAFAFLTQGQKNASEQTKRLTESLMIGIGAANSAEFAFFGLGQAGSKMGGTLGKVFSSIGAYGGIIAGIIGLTAGFVSFFTQTNEAAKKAAEEGLKSYEDRIQRLTIPGKQEEMRTIRMRRLSYESRLAVLTDKATKQIGFAKPQVYEDLLSKDERTEYHFLRSRVEQLNEEEKITSRLLDEDGLRYSTTVGLINQQKLLVTELEKQIEEATTLEQLEARRLSLAKARMDLERIQAGQNPFYDANGNISAYGQDRLRMAETANPLARPGVGKFISKGTKFDLAPTTGADVSGLKTASLQDAGKTLDDILRKEQQALANLIQSFDVLANGLAAIGVGADSFLGKMAQAAKLIANLVASLNQISKEGGSPFASFMNIFGTGLSLFGLLGSQKDYSPSPDVIMERPAAPQFTIILKNPVTLGQGLKVEMPGYERHMQLKRI